MKQDIALQTAVLSKTPQILRIVCDLIDNPVKRGGYLCVTDQLGRIQIKIPVGEIDEDKAHLYAEFVSEKASRLAGHTQHISSWQSRNEKEKMFGGAIRASSLIFSFSAFPEHWDEAFMVALARACVPKDISGDLIARIQQASDNPHICNLLDCVGVYVK